MSKLEKSNITDTLDNLSSVDGMLPVILFICKYSSDRDVRSPMFDGMLPMRQLSARCKIINLDKLTIVEGILPVSLLL